MNVKKYNVRLKDTIEKFTKQLFYFLFDEQNGHDLKAIEATFIQIANTLDLDNSEEMWREFHKLLNEFPAQYMLWDDEPLPETAATLAQSGVESVVFRPAGNRPDEGDYLSIMRENLENLKSIFK